MPRLIHIVTLMLAVVGVNSQVLAQNVPGVGGGSWFGYFQQDAPIQWRGEMLLSLHYTETGTVDELEVAGVIIWRALGGSITKISGRRRGSTITFREIACLSKKCPGVKLGGVYTGHFSSEQDQLSGSAAITGLNFRGSFQLKRIVRPDD